MSRKLVVVLLSLFLCLNLPAVAGNHIRTGVRGGNSNERALLFNDKVKQFFQGESTGAGPSDTIFWDAPVSAKKTSKKKQMMMKKKTKKEKKGAVKMQGKGGRNMKRPKGSGKRSQSPTSVPSASATAAPSRILAVPEFTPTLTPTTTSPSTVAPSPAATSAPMSATTIPTVTATLTPTTTSPSTVAPSLAATSAPIPASTISPTPAVTKVDTAAPTPCPGGEITGFTLIDANSNGDIGPLPGGGTIDTGLVGTQLNVRVDTAGTIGSISFDFDGEFARVERDFPYALVSPSSGYTMVDASDVLFRLLTHSHALSFI
jgi:hypothetical protein